MNVFLVGMPGVGKSFWLKKLRAKYDCTTTDLDLFIEIKTQSRIVQLFEKGEANFREEEARALRQCVEKGSGQSLHIISTGGGTPCFHDNMQYMLENGLVIYLKARPEFIKSRLEQARVVRPLIQNVAEKDRLAYLQELLQQREPYYTQSHLSLDAVTLRISNFAEFFERYKIFPSCTNKQ
ncbi:MAG: shikimate kinase [Taibaiella sp.]|nr:shikimate kinase [Taibaiella sp.]